MHRLLRISQESQQAGGISFARYGSWALLFSWLPVIGDPLCLVGAAGRLLAVCPVGVFGKFVRYLVVANMFLEKLSCVIRWWQS